MSELIQSSTTDGVLKVTFNRPEKKNALTGPMYERLTELLGEAERDRAIKAVIFVGADRCFCAGNDLADFVKAERHGPAPAHGFIHALAASTIPLIAAVDGVAVGIGTTMLLHCDFVYATHETTFSLPFVKLGLVPEAGSSLLLRRLAGYPRAAELLLLGENFDIEVALEIGLVSHVCEHSNLLANAQSTAAKIARLPGAAMRHSKALLKRPDEATSARIEAEVGSFNECLKSPAAQEIISAFVEKRAPDKSKIA